ncbi:MAG TPA: 4'-phosphopantetheinyl transferase superfamily protein [Longimicrobiales bacterium]|nr:4'-phosphopantetheinyl transferase superfamily protein [Longimicrobiales bacterium]
MTGTRAVGNDVVDLLDPRTHGRVGDDRFLARVLHQRELTAVRAAPDPDESLWMHWAAKEAAYKVVSKLRGAPPVFVHRDFVVDGDGVGHEGSRYPLEVTRLGSVIHALSCAGAPPSEVVAGMGELDRSGAPWRGSLEELLARFTEREADPVHSRASAAVRLGARAALASALDVAEERLEIVCAPGVTGRRPPRVLLDGSPAGADVSLSHHGRWIAWALLLG